MPVEMDDIAIRCIEYSREEGPAAVAALVDAPDDDESGTETAPNRIGHLDVSGPKALPAMTSAQNARLGGCGSRDGASSAGGAPPMSACDMV